MNAGEELVYLKECMNVILRNLAEGAVTYVMNLGVINQMS
jgi:hypothetical protein